MNSNKITNIDGISNLTSLIYLEMSGNRIQSISDIKNLKKLQTLKLSNNNISFIEDDLFNEMYFLRYLDLSNNKIRSISSVGCHNNRLFSIYLSNNLIENIQFLTDCTNLSMLSINNNKIDAYPIILNNFKSLFLMDMSFNKMKSVSLQYEIGDLLRILTIDVENIDSFKYLKNDRLISQNFKTNYFKVLVLDIKTDFIDCKLQLDFLKLNILLNLYYSNKVNTFVSLCKNSIYLEF